MKSILLLLFVIIAGASASPKHAQERIIEGIVVELIEDLSIAMKENGMDPFHLTDTAEHRFPVTDLMVLKARVEDLVVVGLSDIVINSVSYRPILGYLDFDISLPRLTANLASSNVDLTVFGYIGDLQASGRLNIMNIRVTGRAVVRLFEGIFSGFSISSISLNLSIHNIRSTLRVFFMGQDYSMDVNNAISGTLPQIYDNNRGDINRLLEHYVMELVADIVIPIRP